ncbi:MAG TPA: hypothetical protein VGI34_02335 [Candidatus Acidoferrales bacterium]
MDRSELWEKAKSVWPWMPAYTWQRCVRRLPDIRPYHLVIGVADHFEPMNQMSGSVLPVERKEQMRRMMKWCREYPASLGAWRDEEGCTFRHTYFYPAENYDPKLIDCLAEHCHAGWGEIEIHLHHGVDAPDTAENTARTLIEFRDALAARGCLSRQIDGGPPLYGFVHGNWALANSDSGRFCGVDDEMQILADTGCYADFTLPAPSHAQIRKINSLYECSLPLNACAPHRRGDNLRRGRAPEKFPLIVQGPLLLDFGRRKRRFRLPKIECGELSRANPPTMRRLRLWQRAAIAVQGRPDWLFVKLHCHGLAPWDEFAMLGAPVQNFLRELVEGPGNGTEYILHFVSMREMVNIILAACDGREGSAGDYRDYRFQPIQASVQA